MALKFGGQKGQAHCNIDKEVKTILDLVKLTRKARKAFVNAHHLPQSQLRICRCCNGFSLIASFSEGEEAKLCIRCRANLRYEMLSTYLRSIPLEWEGITVLELDHRSPLRAQLSRARTYHRSYYSATEKLGSVRPDGARCEDITQLTFGPNSLDLIVSSDVLEHVPNPEAAFRECHRVLRPGGFHLFTVPPRLITRKRAEILDGRVNFLMEPDYHSDPLNTEGILAFWDYGPDAAKMFEARIGGFYRCRAGRERPAGAMEGHKSCRLNKEWECAPPPVDRA